MRFDSSYGVIPLCQIRGIWQVLLIQHKAGYWSFPKGHAEENENPQQAAERELREETGLVIVKLLSNDIVSETYEFEIDGIRTKKSVSYLVAEVTGKLSLQEEEIISGKWIPLSEAVEQITFPQSRGVCQRVQQIVKELSPVTMQSKDI